MGARKLVKCMYIYGLHYEGFIFAACSCSVDKFIWCGLGTVFRVLCESGPAFLTALDLALS